MKKLKRGKNGYYTQSFSYNGKRHYVYATNSDDLPLKVAEKKKQLENMTETRENPTLDEYHTRWETNRSQSIKDSTIRCQSFQYAKCANVIIENAGTRLGSMKLSSIQPDDIREVQRAMLESGDITQTVNDKIAHLSHVFNSALMDRLIDFNPCAPVSNLKRTEELARDHKHRALSLMETKCFFDRASEKEDYYYNLFCFLIKTGCRCGEAGALYESDIRNGKINIVRTITKGLSGYRIGDDAKTKFSIRQIPVNDSLLEIIEKQKVINRRLFDGNIESFDKHRLLFRAPEGGLLMDTPVNRHIRRICKEIGIEPFTAHAFRATFATRMIENNVNPRTVQELLGHSDYGITMNLYGHVLDNTLTEAMKIDIVI